MSPLAQALRSKASIFVPLVVPDLINLFYAELATTMTLAAGDRGYQLVLCITNRDSERAAAYLTAMQSLYAPFVIVAPSSRVEMDTLSSSASETARSSSTVWTSIRPFRVSPSTTAAASSSPSTICARSATAGSATSRASQASTPPTSAWTRTASSPVLNPSSSTAESTPTRVRGGRTAPRRDRPADGDHRGERHDRVRGDLRLAAQGLRVPTDVSVVGFDGLVLSARYNPVLTTIRQPIAVMGNIAIDLAEKKAADGSVDHVVLTPELLVGASTAGPPA